MLPGVTRGAGGLRAAAGARGAAGRAAGAGISLASPARAAVGCFNGLGFLAPGFSGHVDRLVPGDPQSEQPPPPICWFCFL